jgi:hypothetical protein
MFKTIIFLFGFGLTIIILSYIIMYLNLLTLGYNFLEYVNFISRRFECMNFFIGTLLMLIIYFLGGKYELYLWYKYKL